MDTVAHRVYITSQNFVPRLFEFKYRYMKNKRIFPVSSPTACLLKWSWSTIFFQSGTTSSCHRTTKLKIPENNFASFHNLPTKLEDRTRMLQGQWPKNTCNYCRLMEQSGKFSDRMNQLQQQTDPTVNPPEVINDPTAVEVTPTYLEVYFRNTCNMSCVYCGPHLSSKWEEELRRYGPIENFRDKTEFSVTSVQHNPLYNQQKQEFWQYLNDRERYRVIRWFMLLGGEPLVIPELKESLDFWESHPNDKLTFEFTTNLKSTAARIDTLIERFKRMIANKSVYKFKVVASIDCLGPEQEYARYGMKISNFMENWQKLSAVPGVEMSINSAISALTIHGFPQLVQQINEWNKDRKKINRIVHSFNIDTSNTDPRWFGPGVFDESLQQSLDFMPRETFREVQIRKHFEAVIDQIVNAKKQPAKIDSLRAYLTELDRRRNTNWKQIYPWLQDI